MATSPYERRRGVPTRLAGCAAVAVTLTAVSLVAMEAASAAAPEACTPHLVTHSPDGSSGDERAVSITAQSLERGVEGWVNVGWEAAPGTLVTAVTITTTDGSTSTLTEEPSVGSASDVLELRFCGTAEGSDAAPEEPGATYPPKGSQEDAAEEPPGAQEPSPPTRATNSGAARSSSQASVGTSASSSTSDSAADTATSAEAEEADDVDEPTDADGMTATEADEDARDAAEAADRSDVASRSGSSTEEDAPEAAEADVLGVQLSSDAEGSGRAPLLIGLLLALILAGAGGTMWYRRALR